MYVYITQAPDTSRWIYKVDILILLLTPAVTNDAIFEFFIRSGDTSIRFESLVSAIPTTSNTDELNKDAIIIEIKIFFYLHLGMLLK